MAPHPVLIASATGEPLLLLPLGIRRRGPFKVLEWLGGALADYHGPLLRELPAELRSAEAFGALWRRVLDGLPPFDVVHFERQPATIGPLHNPFIKLGCSLHPSRAHSTLIAGTLEDFLKSKRSTSWQRKERRKERRLAEHGDVDFIVATHRDEIDEILPEMMRQKSRSYRDLGVTDLFAVPGYRDFVSALTRRHAADGLVFLCALKIGERIEATHWGVTYESRFYHLLPTYAIDELTRYAPGNVLLRRMFEWCLASGIEVFDFTAGDDEYKAQWCDRTLLLYDYSRGVTLLGSAYVVAVQTRGGVKKLVKRSPVLLERARRVRARLGRLRH